MMMGLQRKVAVVMRILIGLLFLGAGVLILVCAGALYAQATVLHQDWVHPIVIAAILGWMAWGYRPVVLSEMRRS